MTTTRIVAFDAYGTLLDFSAAAAGVADVLGPKTPAVNALWRQKQLEYSWLRSLMGRHADFRQVTREALDYALEAHGLAGDAALADRMMALYDRLPAHADAEGVLRTARDRGLACCVLSNGSPDMLAAGVRSAGLEPWLDTLLSVEQAGIFKPHPSVYRLVCDHYRVDPAAVLFVSANGWDAGGAAAFGFRVVWLNRAGLPAERLPVAPHLVLPDLAALAGHLVAG